MAITLEALLEVLNAVEQPDRGEVQQQAEQQLKIWEAERGYHYLLQDIYLKTELPLSIRWVAIICFKNGVEKYWRTSRTNAISKDEKAQIRNRVFDLLDEKNPQLAIQNAHAVARIVRFDIPSEWPDLFDHVSKTLETYVFLKNNLIASNNLLVILNQVVKAVAMVRIGRARHAFQSKAPLLLPVLVKLYLKLFHLWTSTLDLSVMEVCYMCLKVLRRVIPEGFEQPHKNQDIAEFLKISIGHLQGLVMEHEKYSSDLLEKFVKLYSKLYVNLINSNPTGFVLMPCAQEIISTFMSLLQNKAETIYASSEENDFWAALALKGFLILKKIVAYVYKQGAVTLKQRNDKEEVNHAIALLKTQLFTPQVIIELCDLIINWYLRLKPADLESWLLEPEEWTNEELGSSWEFQVRHCAENFYQDLIMYLNEDLSGYILNKISSGLANNESLENILIKDSTLCTFQLSADSIADKVSFDQLLTQVFIPEGLRNDHVENKIIKRRVCLIISTWVVVNCSRQSRVEIYKLLLNFMDVNNKINDKVVKLTATQSLRVVINDWDFAKQDFQPFLKDFVSLLIAMLGDLSFTESKLYILDTLAALLERCNPLVDQATLVNILQIVPGYWENSGAENNDESILKTSLLRVLKNLVISLNQNSTETHFITIPLIKSCCTQSSEYYYLLSEDGYDLWLSILQYYPSGADIKPELIDFFGLVHPALVDSTEILTTILSIARSYALLAPKTFDSEYGVEIFRVLSGYISTMRDDAFDAFISMMDILFLLQSNDDIFINGLISSGLMNSMIDYVFDENQSIVLANKILVVVSRLAWKSPAAFFQICSHLSLDAAKLMEIWVSYYKNNGNPRNKKVNLLALVSLLAFAAPKDLHDFAKHLGDTFRKCFLYLEEVKEDVSGNSQAYKGDYIYSEVDNYSYLDADILPHGEKIRYLSLLDSKDPVYTVNLRAFLKEKILEMRQETNDETFNGMMSLNDQYTNEKLQELLF
ncbi:ARM repeat-containing protein [Metschnikowia bicuspidata var. bicuspidata NRRL YB-4993]|uniref:ARM repeat-containing protein n=1 Tax=Metschnikowia bicuspidata var. bicuspidata NRRL YB-4993 TaxID=869754 RepID=A0A1A0H1S1_9ASCO|nr:ARM repeat-containing protein [Metschnikowia bicuspidata var. bicuspidata NRRL YB-4993]OBA17976.1 ARM repeat-containing protein [Metschnikowia bicuspidata var. bicuspidata NRRL YB-4993]